MTPNNTQRDDSSTGSNDMNREQQPKGQQGSSQGATNRTQNQASQGAGTGSGSSTPSNANSLYQRGGEADHHGLTKADTRSTES